MAFSSISDLWNKWNIRGFVILSLSLQVFLILFAPIRKRTTNNHIVYSLWLAYLMADWVAAFGIGLISHNQGNSSASVGEVDRALQAFWASFLLLHLGGVDTITALSLEDSLLWRRHLLSLIFQVGAAVYVFGQIFPSDKSLLIPTMLVFLAGVIKNVERTVALNFSSLPRLRESMLSEHKSSEIGYNELFEELDILGHGYSDEEEAKLVESIVVKHASYFFQIFKVFLGDLIFTRRKREVSHEYFSKVSAMDALRVISVELHFIYEVLHTKALVIRSKRSYIFRFIAFTNVVTALILFNRWKKHRPPKVDVDITSFLLYGGIALDVIALFLLIFSDWTVAKIKWSDTRSSKLDSFLQKLVSAMDHMRKPRFATCKVEGNGNVTYTFLNTPLIFRRWSESIFACNLLSESLEDNPKTMYKHHRSWGIITFSNICSFLLSMAKKVMSRFNQAGETIAKGCSMRNHTRGKISMIANTTYVSKNPFFNKLWVFIFKEVRRKSKTVDDLTEVKKIFEARGDLFLKSRPNEINCDNLLRYVTEANYDVSIITWHLATEIWYNKESLIARNDKREFSKILSDYMLYLLLNQPNVVSTVAGIAQMTAAELLREIQLRRNTKVRNVKWLCKTLYEDPFIYKYPESVLVEGIDLAKEMESLKDKKWEVMSGVWVEMLSYAAIHIKGETHVQVLSKGGELLAFVWLLMVHFGCFYKPEWGLYYKPREIWYK